MFALLTLSLAFAGEQDLRYALTVNGAVVGSREVTIHYLDGPKGERRVVESYTKLAFAGQSLTCRAVGSSSGRTATFSSSIDLNGQISQVQGVQLPGAGWSVHYAGGGKQQDVDYPRTEGLLTSLDVVDPGRSWLLGLGGKATLLFVETGDGAPGTLSAGEAAQVSVGGQSVPGTRYKLYTGSTAASFTVDENGLLLDSEVSWLGVKVAARLEAMPAPPDFGAIETIESLGGGVKSSEL